MLKPRRVWRRRYWGSIRASSLRSWATHRSRSTNSSARKSSALTNRGDGMTSRYIDLTYEVTDHVALITLNRPDKLNALSPGMTETLSVALDDAQKDDGVRVVVITGAGRGFCSGQDLSAR